MSYTGRVPQVHHVRNRKPEIVRFSDLPAPEPIDTSQAIPAMELTMKRILEEEPEILNVFAELERTQGRGMKGWHAFVDRHGTSPKAALSRLVGWGARNPRLRSQRAYEKVISRMWDLLL